MNRTSFFFFSPLDIFGTCKLKQWGRDIMVFMLFVLVHSAQHAAPIDRRRGQKDRVKGHSVQQRGNFTPTTVVGLLLSWRWLVGALEGRGGAGVPILRFENLTSCTSKQTHKKANTVAVQPKRRPRTQAARQGDGFQRRSTREHVERCESSGSRSRSANDAPRP